MKRFSYFLLSFLALAVLGLFVLKLPNGQPMLSIDSVWQSVTSNISEASDKLANDIVLPTINSQSHQSVQVYSWVDENGITHYSDSQRTGATAVTLKEATVLPAEKVVWPSQHEKPSKNSGPANSDANMLNNIANIKASAEAAVNSIEQRAKQQQKAIDEL